MSISRLSRATGIVVVPILLAFGASRAAAQTGKVTGVVTDASTGQPVEGVQVSLTGTGRGALTGANGRYFILTVPPGIYTVTARRIGFQSAARADVQVQIDVTREVNFALNSSASQLTTVRIEAEQTPLILPGQTGSRTSITADEIDALPTTSIAGVLSLQLGFLNVPTENPDVTSFVDERRGTNLVRIRGGRAAETQTLIDGIPINNFVLGGPGFDITNEAVSEVSYERGGFEAQYGNAMSGIINYATKEGGTAYRGAVSAQSSRLAGALGSDADKARGLDFFQGYMSGPVPGTNGKLRWMFAGRQNTSAAAAYEFDNQIFNPFTNSADIRGNTAFTIDLMKGWRGVGFNAQRDVFGKLTYYFTPSMKLNVGAIDFQSQNQYYNPAFAYAGYDVAAACRAAYPDKAEYCNRQFANGDPKRFEDLLPNNLQFRGVQEYVIQGSTRNDRALQWLNFSHSLGRTTYQFRGGRLSAARDACNYLTGICLGSKIRNFTTAPTAGDFALGQFTPHSRHGAAYTNPGSATENFAGGDTNTTYSARADIQSQVTDHHNLQGGVFYQRHDIRFFEAQNVTKPLDLETIAKYTYGGRPWDAAVYLQDRIEYDFLTLKLGFRFDYTHAPGQFFRNPLDPTNGTTAFEVCEGTAFGGAPFTYTAPTTGQVIQGVAACNIAQDSLQKAARIAQQDDFAKSPVRQQFSPRIGVQFPLTERSSFFANWGIYSQNPTYNAMYTGTGIGRSADSLILDRRRLAGRDTILEIRTNPTIPTRLDTTRATFIPRGASLEGTPYGPNFRQDNGFVPLIGNPQLAIERTSAYEVGFQSEIGRDYSIQVTGFAKDQSGLTGYRNGGVLEDGTTVLDIGQTYNPTGTGVVYRVLVNTDYQTVRGFEVITRRRLQNYWAFTLQYAFQQVFTNAAPPDLEIQKIIEGDVPVRKEIRSEIDQPHLFTGVFRLEFKDQVPTFRFSNWLHQTRFALTTRAASGLPYTPAQVSGRPASFNGSGATDRLDRNSGTGPATWSVDLRAEKGWRTGALRYAGFVQINNVLDRKNCSSVFPTTGDCDSGALVGSRSYIGARQGAPASPPLSISLEGASSTNYDRPNMFGPRRSIMGGLRASF
ncbi:MAG TPA: TonB-dependent receptor [Gemmatimonadaceae bacterium]|nr:TonB-dependent receptor [Gemmatimonadaceae bacterium]